MKKFKIFMVSVLAVFAIGLIAGCAQTKPDGGTQHFHTLTYIPATEATCLQKGNAAYFKCFDCGKTFSDQEGTVEFNDYETEKTDHTVNNSSITKLPTLDEAGELSGTCSECGTTVTQPIEKLTVTQLKITSAPLKTEYYEGEQFSTEGLVITAFISNDTELNVDDYDVSPSVLSVGDTHVNISWRGKTVEIPVTVTLNDAVNVSELNGATLDELYTVRGVYVGVAEEGPTADRELLLKDLENDDIIAVRNIPYGTFPDYGYSYGDELRIVATLKSDGTSNTPNKIYLDFSERNDDISDTVTGHTEVSYLFDNVYEINNQSDMQRFFTVSAAKDYTLVKLSGTIYFNKYTGSDGVSVYRIHMNGSATAVSAIKPDGTRTVSLRSNVMEQNLGTNWDSFLDLSSSYPSYPGIPFNGAVTAVYTGANSAYFQLTILDISFIEDCSEPADPSVFTNAEAVTEIAYAFYRRGTQIQYDQTQSRRNVNPSPEDSSEDKTLYLDCSSYVNACYFEAFGENVMPYSVTEKTPNTANFTAYAKDNPNNDDVIGYWENANYTTSSAIKAILQQVRNMLQAGDVLVYRHGAASGTSGHVYIYVGNDTFLHCTGSSYDYQSDPTLSTDKATTIEKANGAIQLINSSEIFDNTSSTRYLFKKTSTDSIFNFSLLRPLAREMTPTENTRARMLLRGLEVYKSDYDGLYSAASKQVTFGISVTNNSSSAYGQLVITETVPQGLTYSDYTCITTCTISENGNNVTFTFPSIGALNSITVYITFNVSSSYQGNTIVAEDTTTINSFTVKNKIYRTVPNLSFDAQSSLVSKANEYISSSTTFNNPIDMVKQLYSECGYDIFGYTTVSAALADVINTASNTFRTDTAISQMLVPCLYGGLDIKSGYITDNDRTRMVKENYLSTGDIILAEYGSGSVAFVYIEFADSHGLIAVYSETNTAKLVTISNDAYTNVLVTLISYDRYAVLRPSMVI